MGSSQPQAQQAWQAEAGASSSGDASTMDAAGALQRPLQVHGLQQQQYEQQYELYYQQQQYMMHYQMMVQNYQSSRPGVSSSAPLAESTTSLVSDQMTQQLQGEVSAVPTQLEFEQLEAKVKSAEERAKRAAAQSGAFVGQIARYDTQKGHGFVACNETFHKYGKDLFIERETYTQSRIGDTVIFSVGFNKKGVPRACDVQKLKEVTRLRQELEQKRNDAAGPRVVRVGDGNQLTLAGDQRDTKRRKFY